ncbi:GIY-YIG nuclease family protein [Devosia sp.]|uniref:GIY-YIG nuclease family protein n=1 Tax=Devosia sp. TaxID=1871048 RepID=UPI003A908AA4
MEKTYQVYIVTNRKHGTLYTGVTNDLVRRAYEHREGVIAGFSKTHGCTRLVWFETHTDIDAAIAHEKRLKRWRRAFKEALIAERNPEWRDLWWEITGQRDG